MLAYSIIISIFFFALVFLCFTLPGIWIFKPTQKDFTFWEYITLVTTLGFVTFTLIGYLFLILKVPILLIVIIILLDIFSFKLLKVIIKKISFHDKRKLLIFLAVIIIGIIGQLLIISPSGVLRKGDLIFWSAHGHDAAWHIALMEEMKKSFPMQNPSFAGERLVNYHFFSDISPTFFNLFFMIPALDLYFRLFPLLFSLLIGCSSFILGRRIGGRYDSGIWAAIFTYFSGSFGYVFTLLENKTIGGESIFWASQIQSSIGNPPLIESLVITMVLLVILKTFYEKSRFDPPLFLMMALLLGSLIEFKSYGAVVILISIIIVGIWQYIKERKPFILYLSILSSLFSLVLYLPNSNGFERFLIFEPWWFVRTMIVAKDRLNWLDLELKRQTYLSEHNYKRVAQIEITGFLIFLFGNLGMKFVGLWEFIKLLRNSLKSYFNLNLISICLISLILPLLFLQKGVAGNTIQFLQYFLLIFCIFAGVTVSNLLKSINSQLIKVILAVVIITLTIPTQVGLIFNFYSRPPLAKIDKEELTALDFLKRNSPIKSLILTPPFHKNLDIHSSTLPIWAWSDTSYISAFSGRRTYLSDNEQVDIMGYNLETRFNIQKKLFLEDDPEVFEQTLKDIKINYIYFPKILHPAINLNKTHLKKFFSNSLVEIWQI